MQETDCKLSIADYELYSGEKWPLPESDWCKIERIAELRLARQLCLEELPDPMPDDLAMLLANFISYALVDNGANSGVESKSVRNFTIRFNTNASNAWDKLNQYFGDIIGEYSQCCNGVDIETTQSICGEYMGGGCCPSGGGAVAPTIWGIHAGKTATKGFAEGDLLASVNGKVGGLNRDYFYTIDHKPTKSDVGLSNVDNTSDATKEIYEANLKWGGKNLAGKYGPIDAAMIKNLGSNKSAFMPADRITVEYSVDGGATWVDYGASDDAKKRLFSIGGYSFYVGKSQLGHNDPDGLEQLRVTIDTPGKMYTVLNKFCIHCSTSGSTNPTCSISYAKADSEDFNILTENVPIRGWSGYNIINTHDITVGSGAPNHSSYGRLRFEFKHEKNVSDYDGLSIMKIMCFGGVGWNTPSTYAEHGENYSMDTDQNTYFPTDVYARNKSTPVRLANINELNTKFDKTGILDADQVKFSDNQTLQQKYDNGDLTGPAGKAGHDGAPGSDAHITIDSSLSASSTNAVQNKVIKAYIDSKIAAPTAVYKAVSPTIVASQSIQPLATEAVFLENISGLERNSQYQAIVSFGQFDMNDITAQLSLNSSGQTRNFYIKGTSPASYAIPVKTNGSGIVNIDCYLRPQGDQPITGLTIAHAYIDLNYVGKVQTQAITIPAPLPVENPDEPLDIDPDMSVDPDVSVEIKQPTEPKAPLEPTTPDEPQFDHPDKPLKPNKPEIGGGISFDKPKLG